MSRSGYVDDYNPQELNCYRGAVASAIRGARGQAFLREMLAALDALPVKRLVAGEMENEGGFCAIGAVGKARGLDMSKIDSYKSEDVAHVFGIAHVLVYEISHENDKWWRKSETQFDRYERMRRWVVSQLR